MLRPCLNLGQIARACPVVDADVTASEANEVFERHGYATSIAVRTSGQPGLLTRLHLRDVLTGPFGYGWALNQRRTVLQLLPDHQVAFPGHTTLAEAVAVVNQRPAAQRYDDLLVVARHEPIGTVAVSTLLANLADFYAHGASHDSLTGVLSRAAIHDRLVAAVQHGDGRLVAVGYFDLDGFKAINDRLGHEAGDRVLATVAHRLHDAVGDDAVVGRVGGDEFLAVLPAHHHDVLEARLERAIELIALPIAEVDGAVTASVGAAFARATASCATVEASATVRSADGAMYVAKARGGNQYVLAGAVGA